MFVFCLKYFSKISLASIMMLFTLASSAQIKIARINIYFDKNSYSISEKMAVKLDNVIDSIEAWEVDKIYLHGYTDGDAASDYNLKLSEQRCRSVDMFLTDNAVDPDKIIIKPHGEEISSGDLTNELRKAKERRVQIVIGYRQVLLEQIVPDKNTQDTTITQIDTCMKDTLLDMGDGVFSIVNLCEYEKNKQCFSIKKYRLVKCEKEVYSKTKHRLGLKKYVKCKSPYLAFNFYIKTCNDSCFKKPIHIYVPTYYFKNAKARNRFRSNYSGRSNLKAFNGEKYLDLEVKCPGEFWCGTKNYCCIECGKNDKGQYVMLKKGITLIGNYYPNRGDYFNDYLKYCTKKHPDDSITFFPKFTTIDSLVLSYKDSIYLIRDFQLEYLKKSLRRCRFSRPHRFGNSQYILGFKRKNYYRYVRTEYPRFYKIRPKDLKNLTTPSWKPTIEELMKN
jgi:hypothetical protein